MSTTAIPNKALLAAPTDSGAPAAPIIVQVARGLGISPLRQFREAIVLRHGPGRPKLSEYYAAGLFDPDMTMDQKREFVGEAGSYRLNQSLSPRNATPTRGLVRDKVLYGALLTQLGLPATVTRAVASADRQFGNIRALKSPAELGEFLRKDAVFPLFAKPCEGSGSVGSALLSGVEGNDIVMGNGHHEGLDAFCAEVFRDYPDGFIFQDALVQHPDLTAIAGPAIGSLRVVTIRDGDRPRVLYAVWKIPSPEAMSDNFWQSGSMVAEIKSGGQVARCRAGTGMDAHWLSDHPVSGKTFASLTIPFWDRVIDLTESAHAIFPDFGVFGFDVAITPDGPVIIECNANPFHSLWQIANGRGILNADFRPVFDAAAEKSAQRLKTRIGLATKRRRDRRG